MLDPGGHKSALRTMRENLERLQANYPPDAQRMQTLIRVLRSDLDEALGRWLAPVSAAQRKLLVERCDALTRLCAGVIALREEAAAGLEELQALLKDCDRLPDWVIADWFRRRGNDCLAILSPLGLEADDEAGLDNARKRLNRVQQVIAQDRRRLALLAEGLERLARVRVATRTAPLAALLARLRHQMSARDFQIDPALEAEIRSAVEGLRAFEKRDQPPEIDDLGETMRRMEEWLRVLEKAERHQASQRLEDRLRRLNQEVAAFMQDWSTREDDQARPILETAQHLEHDLINEAQALHDALIGRLEEARSIFQRFADPARAPNLVDTLTGLIGESPQTPGTLLVWRTRALGAIDQFEAAIGGYRPEIERTCQRLAVEVQESLDRLAAMRLDNERRRRKLELGGRLDALAKEPFQGLATPDLGDVHERLRALTEETASLEQEASALLDGITGTLEAIAQRIRRLRRLAEPLDVPLPPQLLALENAELPGDASLETLRQRCDERRALAAAIERDLLDQCWIRLERSLDEVGAYRALLDPELAAAIELPRAHGRDLDAAEARQALLPELHPALDEALHRQLERLQRRREVALQDPGAKNAHPGADGEALAKVIAVLHAWRDEPTQPPAERVRGLAALVSAAERRLSHLRATRVERAERRARMARRLAALQEEYFEVSAQRHLLERISALIGEVPNVETDDRQAADQLNLAGRWLSALERHAANCAGSLLRTHLETLSKCAPGNHAALTASIADGSHERPHHDLRDEAMRLARQHQEG